MSIFNIVAYKGFGRKRYSTLTENSQRIVDYCVDLINEKYNKQYDASKSFGIRHDGSCEWFFIGFYDPSNEADSHGCVWYLMHANVINLEEPTNPTSENLMRYSQQYDDIIRAAEERYILNADDAGKVDNEETNFIGNHTIEVISAHDYYERINGN